MKKKDYITNNREARKRNGIVHHQTSQMLNEQSLSSNIKIGDQKMVNSAKAEEIWSKKITKTLNKYSSLIDQMPEDINSKKDEVALNLYNIECTAKSKGLSQVQGIANYRLGDRLLKLEVETKRREKRNKLQKKQKMEEQICKQKQIIQFNYDGLIQKKLIENSFIIRPNTNGKGFVQSDIYEQQYTNTYFKQLQYCDYIQVSKQVNTIFMRNFSYGSQNNQKNNNSPICIWLSIFFVIVLAVLIIIQAHEHNLGLLYSIFALSGLIFCLTGFVCFKRYFNKPNTNNHFQQTLQDVGVYFAQLNKKNRDQGKKIFWSFPNNFMYLQVHFENGIDSNFQ